MDNEFHAYIKSGKVQWVRPEAARDFIASLEGKRIKIIIEEPTRTKSQNRAMHSLFTAIAERIGRSPAYVKAAMKAIFLAEEDRGTSDMSVGEASEFLEFCLCFAAQELDLVLWIEE